MSQFISAVRTRALYPLSVCCLVARIEEMETPDQALEWSGRRSIF